jgi:hypothetical protein
METCRAIIGVVTPSFPALDLLYRYTSVGDIGTPKVHQCREVQESLPEYTRTTIALFMQVTVRK